MATNRIGKLQSRRSGSAIGSLAMDQSLLKEAYASVQEDEAVKYAIGAMQPIDPAYTANCFSEGDRVKAQLQSGFDKSGQGVEFAYQGSVTSDTHIRAHSDIDLLTLHGGFFTVQAPGVPQFPYNGDVVADLNSLRTRASRILKDAFPQVTVDDRPGKSIAMSGGSLRRKVDVVIGNWWNTWDYQSLKLDHLRGVYILDSKKDERIGNIPFLHNFNINNRDALTAGGLRKVIRLLKSLKYDADTDVTISSYDIAALAYAMPDHLLAVPYGNEMRLVGNAKSWLEQVIVNGELRSSLQVPNGTRRIFCTDGANEAGLQSLYRELAGLVNDIQNGLARSFRKLEEARIAY